ncbi:4Fe-4S dicluster domain-containing protein [Chloroflexota bacterium]
MSKQYGMLVDIESCLGCGICVVACKQEHDLPPTKDDIPGTKGIAWNQVLSFPEGIYPEMTMEYLYLQCMHCEEPPCRVSCPKDAIFKRDDGIVLFDKNKCDGCKNVPQGPKCIPACPYGIIQLDKKGIAEACTLCTHLVDKGLEPACVKACIGGSLIFGDINDPNSKVSKKIKEAGDRVFMLKPESGAKPCLRYIIPKAVNMERMTSLNQATKLYGFEKQK